MVLVVSPVLQRKSVPGWLATAVSKTSSPLQSNLSELLLMVTSGITLKLMLIASHVLEHSLPLVKDAV